jgi:hypothetical protein
MISTNVTFDTANARSNRKPVYIAQMEKDYLSALLTDYSQWGAGSGGDYVSEEGSLKIIKAATDAMSRVTGYGTPVITMNGSTGDDHKIRLRLKSSFDTILTDFKLEARYTYNGGDPTLSCTIAEYTDTVGSSAENKLFTFVSAPAGGTASNTVTGSFASYTFTFASPIDIAANKVYYIELEISDSASIIEIRQWNPNENIFGSHKGYHEGALELGKFRLDIDGNIDLTTDFFDGKIWIKSLTLDGYSSSYGNVHTSLWLPIKNQAGSNTAPTASGQLRLSTTLPNGASVSMHIYGDADGSDPGQVDLGTIADGGTVSAYAYYKAVITMSTTIWSVTPVVQAVQYYFPITEKICFNDDAFDTYRSVLGDMPSFDATLNPLDCKSSLSVEQLDIADHKEGINKTQSWISKFITDYYILSGELNIYFGFSDIAEGYFIKYQQAVLNDYEDMGGFIRFMFRDQMHLLKDPLVIDINTDLPSLVYLDQKPVQVILDLISRVVPKRLLYETSFTDIETASFSSWRVSRPILSSKKSVKELTDELSLLLGCPIIQKEDGKLHLINLFDEVTAVSATLDDDNSDEVGRCKFNLDKRINDARVRRGYWDLSAYEEAADKYYDISINADSVTKTGRNKEYLLDNQWLTVDTQVGAEYQSQIVADRMTDFFAQGMWIIRRKTSDKYMYLQQGDFLNVTGYQILYKGVSVLSTKRGVIIGKNPVTTSHEIIWTIFLIKPWP